MTETIEKETSSSGEGFFTEEQLDRMNIKTMANELPEPYNGNHLFALLMLMSAERTSELMEEGNEKSIALSNRSKQDVVDWYCSTPAEPTEDFDKQTVVEKIKSVEKINAYKTLVKLVSDIHDHGNQNDRG